MHSKEGGGARPRSPRARAKTLLTFSAQLNRNLGGKLPECLTSLPLIEEIILEMTAVSGPSALCRPTCMSRCKLNLYSFHLPDHRMNWRGGLEGQGARSSKSGLSTCFKVVGPRGCVCARAFVSDPPSPPQGPSRRSRSPRSKS